MLKKGWTVIVVLLLLHIGSAKGDTLSELAGRYTIEPSSSFKFFVSQIGGGGIAGMFGKFSGAFILRPNDIARSRAVFTLQPASVETGQPRVEQFLRSSAVFDTDNYPQILFRSFRVEPTGQDTALIYGMLSARGRTHEETFTATLIGHDGRDVAFKVEGDILRSRYGMDVGTPIYSNVVHFDMVMRGRQS